MRNKLVIILFLLAYCVNAQVTFVINELPEAHDFNKDIYISGSFEGWTGGSDDYKLSKSDNQYSITLPKEKACNVLFKFTLGSWETEELDVNGDKIDNRNYTCQEKPETVYITILNWGTRDSVVSSTAQENVKILSEDFKIPQLDRERKIWVYLPPNYKTSNKSFPVIYMHDGQNLFDSSTAYSDEWEVDETLNRLFKEKQVELIVVGIDNGGNKRLDEYSPWVNKKYGGGEGDHYMEFIVNTLKPYIDSNFRTRSDKENTAIIGSSMGGLISYYAALEYPDVFGKAGIYSPSFWFSQKSISFAKTKEKLQDSKLYFLAGGKEGGNTDFNEINQTVRDMNTVVEILKSQGVPSKNMYSTVIPEGEHNEKLWKESFEETILWLFPEAVQERKFIKAELNNNQLEIEVSNGRYLSKFYSSEIIETSFIPEGEKYNSNSHAVVLDKTFSNVDYTESESQVVFKMDDLTLVVQKNPLNISYWYKGKKLTEEKNGYYRTDPHENIDFALTEDEILYGGGARALGMNRRGHRLQLYNKAHYGYETESELMNYTMPIVISSNQYMLHFDNAPIGYLDLDSNKDNTLTYETISGRKTYQVIAGGSWLDLIDNYTNLTGKQPLPPRWAFGNFSSRFGYHSQQEVEETIDKFKEEDIPVDAVIIDIYWFGKDIQGHMGNLEFYRDSFPNPKQMIKGLSDKGVKTVLVTEPFILTTSKRWDDAVAKNILAKDSIGNPARYDFYFGNTGIVDVYNPKGRTWFWNIYKSLAEMGVKGIWGDLGEPEVHPTWVQHATGSADEVHNTYGHDWARLVYEGYEKDFPNQRPFILMRSGSSGSQRFGLIPWSGDVNRTWGGLQSQTEIALQMSMQGLAYMHSDLGGFAGANLDDELYTRWLQYGVFQPIYRPHAQEEVPAEPVFREEKTKQQAKQAIELRYRLLPYNYTLAFENNQTGKPLMRPLFFEEPNNSEQLVNASTYLWGNDFLVTPIVNPEITEKEVYFPKDYMWFDFYTDEKVSGGQSKMVSTSISSIPTFVRAGAFIPLAELVQSTDNYNLNSFDLHYYYHNSIDESERTFYNDDGLTPNAFEKGKYELLTFEAELEENNLEIDFEAETGNNYQTNTKNIKVIVHNIDWKPTTVKVNGKRVSVNWQSNNTLSIPVTWNTSKEIEIKIKLK
ncbi:TIM-barrel domain-containing protein [Hanstruepera ponticola]|uniref:TIM-barrel domain-containing protein n=1 Tax=Hanstruepera ponticola TaxID=2042995 RepID=UPI001CA931C9|nr:TIM-barrel domain-containing protein [Hanstruepera ponticola]